MGMENTRGMRQEGRERECVRGNVSVCLSVCECVCEYAYTCECVRERKSV